MIPMIVLSLVGDVMIVFGVLFCGGILKPLHSYHYKRLKKADRRKFGQQVGLGTMIMGTSVIFLGISIYVYEKMQYDCIILIGLCLMFAGMIAGTAITVRAMKKYNKGIF